MKRFCFPENIYKEGVFEKTTRIICKCECGHELLWMDTWDDETKAEVQAKIDAHHNDHINFEKV